MIKKVVLNIEDSIPNYFNNTLLFVSECLQEAFFFSEDNSIIEKKGLSRQLFFATP